MCTPRNRWATAIIILCLLSLSQQLLARKAPDTITLTPPTVQSLKHLKPPTIPSIDQPIDGVATSPKDALAQIPGQIKKTLVQFKNGSIQLYTNHQKCSQIRAKQRAFVKAKKDNMPKEERKNIPNYYPTAGGISYSDFDFLQKGKVDRVKVLQMGLMMAYGSNYIPYVFMFAPDMLPGPLQPATRAVEETWNAISRERSHAVVSTLLALERGAHVVNPLTKLNPFGGKASRRTMARLDAMGKYGATLLTTKGFNGIAGADMVMELFKEQIYTTPFVSTFFNRGDKTGIKTVPKCIIRGVSRMLEAPNFSNIWPTFFLRGKVINHLQTLSLSDEFLVAHNVDLDSLSNEEIAEACSRRLIGGKDVEEKYLREGLASWLDLVVKEPTQEVQRTGLEYNANLARLALLCYHAVDGARDARVSSTLPRLLHQGQFRYMRQDEEAEGRVELTVGASDT